MPPEHFDCEEKQILWLRQYAKKGRCDIWITIYHRRSDIKLASCSCSSLDDIITNMEPQTHRPKLNAEYFFLSIGMLATLVTSVTAFLNLVFETLNKRFPDVLNASYQYGYSTYQYEGMRTALATLVIFFPVYLAVSYYWRKYANEKIQGGMFGAADEIIRKWTIYIILFLASVVAVV